MARQKCKGVLNRGVTVAECPWLKNDLKAGTVVHDFTGPTYGCISFTGVPVNLDASDEGCFEVPMDSVDWEPGYVDTQRRMYIPKK